MIAAAASYWSDPAHVTWREHYFLGRSGGHILGFTEAWKLANLPANSSYDLTITLFDRQDEKTYSMPIYTAYENDIRTELMDDDWHEVAPHSLQSYFYSLHHCPCHRKQAAAKAGAITDEECEGDRFVVQSIVAPSLPDLILYSETLTLEELEERLIAGKP